MGLCGAQVRRPLCPAKRPPPPGAPLPGLGTRRRFATELVVRSPVFSSPQVWKKSLNPDPEGRGYPRLQVRKLPGQSPLTQELHGNRKERKESQERGQLHGPGLILFLQGWRGESRENQDSEGAGSPCPSPPLCRTS